MIKEITNIKKEKNMKQDFGKAIERLLDGIRSDYLRWSSPEAGDDDRMKQTKLRMIDEFNQGVRVRFGRKYTKVIQGSSVWGFIANDDGVLKGIPYKKGDVFKRDGKILVFREVPFLIKERIGLGGQDRGTCNDEQD